MSSTGLEQDHWCLQFAKQIQLFKWRWTWICIWAIVWWIIVDRLNGTKSPLSLYRWAADRIWSTTRVTTGVLWVLFYSRAVQCAPQELLLRYSWYYSVGTVHWGVCSVHYKSDYWVHRNYKALRPVQCTVCTTRSSTRVLLVLCTEAECALTDYQKHY